MLFAIGVGLIFALTAATGYFVAQEFAYVAVDRSALRTRAQKNDASATRALAVTDRLSFVLSGSQLGITLTAILVGFVAEPFLGQGIEAALINLSLPQSTATALAAITTMLIATIIQMVLGELAPKNWAIATSEHLACHLSRSTLIYLAIAGPIIHIFDSAARAVLHMFGIEPAEELINAATPEDLQHIIAESGDKGLLDNDTSLLLQRGLDFHNLSIRSAMIPRIDVITIGADESASRVVEMLDTGHTRFPVMGNSIDDLIGTISVADLVAIAPEQRHLTQVHNLVTEAFILPESISLTAALEHMRSEHHQFACITDEHGSFSGVLTLEDIAEELVGEIRDEDDPPEVTAIELPNGSWTLPARWRIDQLAQTTGIELPESDDYETISGIILSELGRLPNIGDTITVNQIPPPALSENASRVATITVQSVEHGVAEIVNIKSEEQENKQQESKSS